MRILFLSSIYPRASAPVRGIYCHSLCRALAARHEVWVISPVGWTERVRHRRLFAGGRTAPAANGPPVEYPWYFYPPKLFRSWYGDFMWRSARRSVRRVLAEFAPDCVLSYWLHPDGEVAVRAAREAGIPAAVIVGGSDARLLPAEPGRRRSIQRVLTGADALITVSRGLADKVVELGAPEANIRVIYQGIDRAMFCPGDRSAARARLGIPAGQKALLWVGGMVPVKGLDILIGALARVRRGGTDCHLYLVGDGPLRSSLAGAVAAAGLAGAVTFVGPMTPDRLPDWYRAADLTVLSSHSEGIPNVLRESLACGTPFVSTRVGDITELWPDADLVPPGDPAALAGAVRRVLAGNGARPALPSPASWDDYADEVAGLLGELVARAGAHRPSAADRAALAT
jgi:glycosyltransferase involved in cell wall biosynthesis